MQKNVLNVLGPLLVVLLAACGSSSHHNVSSTSSSTVPTVLSPTTAAVTTTSTLDEPGSGSVPAPGSTATPPVSKPTASSTTSPKMYPLPQSGAYGTVSAGPTCPVERANQPCPPRPVSGTVSASSGGATRGSTHTDSSGNYALSLPPGTYTLTVDTGSTYPRCPSTQVTVTGGAPVRADISCDTGIR